LFGKLLKLLKIHFLKRWSQNFQIGFAPIFSKVEGYQVLNESLRWLRYRLRYGKNPTDEGDKTPEIDNPQPSS